MERERVELEELREKGVVVERPFTSNTPILGQLIVWFRTAWNNVAARWYVRPLLKQQNTFNQLATAELETHLQRGSEQTQQLIEQDRSQMQLVHETAVLTAQVRQMNQALADLEERLAQLEIKPDQNTNMQNS